MSQYRPTQEELLLAIADFIEGDIRPEVEDKALRFRCLIAANLARMCVLERRMEEWHDGVELDGLRALAGEVPALGDVPDALPTTKEARADLLQSLNDRLAAAIRDGHADPDAALAHLRRTLKGRLGVTNPRFDTEAGW